LTRECYCEEGKYKYFDGALGFDDWVKCDVDECGECANDDCTSWIAGYYYVDDGFGEVLWSPWNTDSNYMEDWAACINNGN
jgi:hypothetical protein